MEGEAPSVPGALSCIHSSLRGELVSELGKAGAERLATGPKYHRLVTLMTLGSSGGLSQFRTGAFPLGVGPVVHSPARRGDH